MYIESIMNSMWIESFNECYNNNPHLLPAQEIINKMMSSIKFEDDI